MLQEFNLGCACWWANHQMSSPERSRWPIFPTKWRAFMSNKEITMRALSTNQITRWNWTISALDCPPSRCNHWKSHHWRNGGSFWMMINLCTSKMVKLGNQPVNKWLVGLPGFMYLSFNDIYPESWISLVGEFCVTDSTMVMHHYVGPSLPNILWVGIRTHKNFLRRPLGDPNAYSQGIWRILED